MSAAAGTAGMPTGQGTCTITFSKSDANLASTASIGGKCAVAAYDDGHGHTQVNYDISDAESGVMRDFNIDFFTPEKAGASAKIEDGYDPAAPMGAVASYLESKDATSKVWNADKGTVTIESVAGVHIARLVGIHLAVLPGSIDNAATGTFVVDGTISAELTKP